jgi:glycosyltransferase 2 family protein
MVPKVRTEVEAANELPGSSVVVRRSRCGANRVESVRQIVTPEKRGRIRQKTNWLRRVGPFVLGLVLVCVAAFLLHRTLSRYRIEEIEESLSQIPPSRIALAGLFAAASYLCLTGFDWLALRFVGQRLPYRRVALASFCSLSLGHNIGFAALSSGALRYRFYSRWGMSGESVAKVILFCGVTVGLGLIGLGGGVLLLRSALAAELTGLSRAAVLGMGFVCLMILTVYLALCAWLRKPLRVRNWRFEMPSLRLGLAQTVIGPLNFACVAACLYETLLAAADISYFAVAAVYVIANVTALISHVPGGLGVIESVVLYLIPEANAVGALIAFRVVYFLIPLCVGAPVFALTELFYGRRRLSAA